MESWLGQYCINITDLEKTIAFYEAIGLTCTSRTDIQVAKEAILEDANGKGGKIQLAQQLKQEGPIDMGTAFWKLYVNTNDIDRMYKAAIDFGCGSVTVPARAERWPVTVGFVKDPDGYLVEFVQRHPWLDGDETTQAWVGQYCINVTDIDATIKFYETLGLECTSQTDIAVAKEAILENPAKGGKVQLAQQLKQEGLIDMGTAMWKLYVHTDNCEGLYKAATAAGYRSVTEPMKLERWNTTIAFVADPDNYQVELVQRHPD
ncbi:MAG: VOC family protein [Acidimicrobiia bacterium]